MSISKPSTTNPVPVDDIAGDGRWLSQHSRLIATSQLEEGDVIFLGDSIIQRLQDTDVWRELFLPLNSLNFGIGGDTTQNLLWRIADGEIDRLKPKYGRPYLGACGGVSPVHKVFLCHLTACQVVILHVGTNNFSNSAEEVAEGILEVVRLLEEKKPHSKIVLVELFPRGEHTNRQREKHKAVNQMLRDTLKEHRNVRVVDLDPGFVASDGRIHHSDMHDYLHLTNTAYKKAFEPLYNILVALIGEAELEKEIAIHRQNTI